jgi:F420-non-reducing hydrogenase iron-sulfur subunit
MEFTESSPAVTVFACANCARSGQSFTKAARSKPDFPDFNWPKSVQQVVIPCSGRLQPEHVLKAFESGSSIVAIIGCEEDNCHYIEGSMRCSRRVDYIRSILNEIGLGDERLLFFRLPGSAAEDLMAASGKSSSDKELAETLNSKIADIFAKTMAALQIYPSTPLRSEGCGHE